MVGLLAWFASWRRTEPGVGSLRPGMTWSEPSGAMVATWRGPSNPSAWPTSVNMIRAPSGVHVGCVARWSAGPNAVTARRSLPSGRIVYRLDGSSVAWYSPRSYVVNTIRSSDGCQSG